jgi:hypothetical protein
VHRRQFLSGLAALALSSRSSAAEVGVNGARLNRRLRELVSFGRTPEGGISRVAFSDRASLDGSRIRRDHPFFRYSPATKPTKCRPSYANSVEIIATADGA